MTPEVATVLVEVMVVTPVGAGLMGISGMAHGGAVSGVPSPSGGGAYGGLSGSTRLGPPPVSGNVTVPAIVVMLLVPSPLGVTSV